MLPRIHKSGVAGLVGSNLVDKLVTGSLAHVGLDVFLTREERLLDASW
jgi:nucleoside-diphosphate-sugar epimerase